MLTDEQLANELVGKCPRCLRDVKLRWMYDYKARRNYRVFVKHREPGSRCLCSGRGLEYREKDT